MTESGKCPFGYSLRLAAGQEVARICQEPALAWLERQAQAAEEVIGHDGPKDVRPTHDALSGRRGVVVVGAQAAPSSGCYRRATASCLRYSR